MKDARHEPGLGFRDRSDAGQALGHELLKRDWSDPVVLAVPRGGVPVAYEVARLLDAPLDVLVVRKIGHPRHTEFSLGAVAPGGVSIMNTEQPGFFADLPHEELAELVERERDALARHEELYRDEREPPALEGHEVILVDDGIATGATMRAAVKAVRRLNPSKLVVAVPVGAAESVDALRTVADEVVCLRTPEPFRAVEAWYDKFPPVPDDEVCELLAEARHYVAT